MELLWSWSENTERLFTSKEEAVEDYLEDVSDSPSNNIGKVKLFAWERMEHRGYLDAQYVVDDLLEKLDQDFGDPEDFSKSTNKMIKAAQNLIEAIEEDYVSWACGRAPEFDCEYEIKE